MIEILGFGIDPAIVVFGFGVGLLIGVTGMGGASLMTPLLILLFGVKPLTAVGTDILYAAVTKTVGGYKHLRLGTVHRGIVFWLAVGSVPSAMAGVWAVELLQRRHGDAIDGIMLGMLGGALLVVGVVTLLRSLFAGGAIHERSQIHLCGRHIAAAVVTGMVTGFVIGFTSAGSGTLIAIALIAIFRLTPHRVVGTDVLHAAVLLWVAGAAHWIAGNVDLALAGTILAGSIPGVLVGAGLSVRAPQSLLRYALAVVLIASGVTLIAKEGEPRVVVPAVAVAGVMVGALFAAQAILRGRSKLRPEPGGVAPG